MSDIKDHGFSCDKIDVISGFNLLGLPANLGSGVSP